MTATKKRGAPRGNTNALKHGYYSERFRKKEVENMVFSSEKLEDEIKLLKVLILRMFEAADNEEDNLETWLKSLQTLGVSLTRLVTLLNAQQRMSGEKDDFRKAISDSVNRVTKSKGIDKRLGPPNR